MNTKEKLSGTFDNLLSLGWYMLWDFLVLFGPAIKWVVIIGVLYLFWNFVKIFKSGIIDILIWTLEKLR